MLPAASGLPLIKSTAKLGWRLVVEHCVSTFDADMPIDLVKKELRKDFDTFKDWMRKESGAKFKRVLRIEGPTPHIGYAPNHIQHGDAGGTREIARNLSADSTDTGKVDYRTYCVFEAREFINEIPTDLAVELFAKGRQGLRPLRDREWKQRGNAWSPR